MKREESIYNCCNKCPNDDAVTCRLCIEPIKEMMADERDCCGTFKGTPHRKTCDKWKGKQ